MALEYLAKGNAIQLSINTLSPGCSIKWHLDLETPRHHFNKAHLSWIAVSAPFSQPGTHLRVTKSSQENTRIQRYHVNVMPLPWPLATLQPHSQPQAFLEPTCTGWVDFVNDNDHSTDSWQHLSAVARVRGPLVSHNTTTCGVCKGFIPNLWRFWASWLYGFNPASPQPSKEAYVVLPAKNPPWSNSRSCSCHFHKCLPATCILAFFPRHLLTLEHWPTRPKRSKVEPCACTITGLLTRLGTNYSTVLSVSCLWFHILRSTTMRNFPDVHWTLYVHNMSSAPSEIFYLAQLVLVVSSLASNVNCGKTSWCCSRFTGALTSACTFQLSCVTGKNMKIYIVTVA